MINWHIVIDNIERRIQRDNVSMAQLALKSGVGMNRLVEILAHAGDKSPAEESGAIAEALGMSPEEWLEGAAETA